MKNKDFVHLHCHSHFSLFDAIPKPKELVEKAHQLGFKALALTDHASISGLWRFYKNCKEKNIKPILGCEFYVVQDANTKGIQVVDEEKKQGFRTIKQTVYHLVLLTKNYEGFKELCKLISYANDENHFYYKPRISWDYLNQIQTSNLIALSGCGDGFLGYNIQNNNFVKIDKHIKFMKKLFKDDYYLELQPHNMDAQRMVNLSLIELSKRYKLPLVLTNDIHYLNQNDSWVRDVMHCIGYKEKYYDKNRTIFDLEGIYLKTADEMIDTCKKYHSKISDKIIKEAMNNTLKIANKINIDFKIPSIHKMLPSLFLPKKFNNYKEWLWYLSFQGLKNKNLHQKKEYLKRLKEEYDLITSLQFEKYFLIVWDLIKWAKSQIIMVGTARGSVASSLLAYCLNITNVDPIKHNLLFFRFISPSRDDLPDIDIDFQDNRRHEIKEYLKRKYGKNHVAHMITHSLLKGRAVLKDVCRVFDVPLKEANKITKYILQGSFAKTHQTFTIEDSIKTFKEAKIFANKYPQVIKVAQKLEGRVRHHGVHAAGLIISLQDLTEYCGLIRTNLGTAIPFDKNDSKEGELNLLKLDVLGLSNLTIIQKTLDLIKKRHNKDIDVYNLKLDDKKIIKEFDKANTIGIFQFDTYAFRKLCNNMEITKFEHLAHANAISRPGTLGSGATKRYIDVQKGRKKIKYEHPDIEHILKSTYGEVIFQEQLMEILSNIGNFNWIEISQIRQAISKTLGAEYFLDKQDKFIENAVKKGIPRITASNMYRGYMHYGSWTFNKAHAVAYSLLGYINMYLKVYYPLEFLISNLIVDKKNEQNLLQECNRYGIEILPPDINKSTIEYSIEKNAIRQGFNQIMGMGNRASNHIIEKQTFKDWIDFLDKIERRTVNSARIKNLIKAGVFKCWFPNEIETLNNLDDLLKKKITIIDEVANTKPMKEEYSTDVIKKLINFSKWRKIEQNFISNLSNFYKQYYIKNYVKVIECARDLVVISGIIVSINSKKYKETVKNVKGSTLFSAKESERMYCNLSISNGQGVISVNMKPEVFEKYKVWMLEEGMNKPVSIIGKVLKEKDRVYASEMFVLDKKIKNCRLFENLFDKYRTIIKKYNLKTLSDRKKVFIRSSYSFATVIENYHFWITKKGKIMTFLKLSDENEIAKNVIFWSDATKKYKEYLEVGEIYAMHLEKNDRGGLVFNSKAGNKIKKLKELK